MARLKWVAILHLSTSWDYRNTESERDRPVVHWSSIIEPYLSYRFSSTFFIKNMVNNVDWTWSILDMHFFK